MSHSLERVRNGTRPPAVLNGPTACLQNREIVPFVRTHAPHPVWSTPAKPAHASIPARPGVVQTKPRPGRVSSQQWEVTGRALRAGAARKSARSTGFPARSGASVSPRASHPGGFRTAYAPSDVPPCPLPSEYGRPSCAGGCLRPGCARVQYVKDQPSGRCTLRDVSRPAVRTPLFRGRN
jgi:hypothetical protein